jgi:PHD/YefM family antitoxin component YafN of YafNO toxin-antitoxin module
MPQLATISTTDLRQNLADVIDDVSNRNFVYHIQKHGEVEVGIIGKDLLDEFEDYLMSKDPDLIRSSKLARQQIASGDTMTMDMIKVKYGL